MANNQPILAISNAATPTVITVQPIGIQGARGVTGPTGPAGEALVTNEIVASLNGITGNLGICGGTYINVVTSGKTLTISYNGPTENVFSVNGITGAIGVDGSTYINVVTSGKTLTISTKNIVTSFAGLSGGITLFAGTGISYLTSVRGITLLAKAAQTAKSYSDDVLGVAAFNSDDFVLRSGIVYLQPTTIRGQIGLRSTNADYGITFAGATGQAIYTIATDTHLYIGISAATTGICGVAYFKDTDFNVASDGQVSLKSTGISGDYVKNINGYTGGITFFASNGFTFTQSSRGLTLSLVLGLTANSDGFEIVGGSTPRKLSLTGGDVTIAGSTSAVSITFPTVSTTLVGVHNAVQYLNGFTGGVTLQQGTGINLSSSNNIITIAASGTVSATPAGTTYDIQYNYNAGMSASQSFKFNAETGMLGITGDITVTGTYYGTIDGGTY